ncbi:MAG: type I 3-dehydroquinate dehydratase [Candidatus Thermoplasmatota archaeon]|nr:type I 3-dehydroquinate dehydratase [Candidatus Thermoplasmatota archaeon]
MSRPLVCVTLSGYTVDDILKDAAVATAAGADLVEVRLDLLWAREKEKNPATNGKEDVSDGDSKGPKYIPPEIVLQPLDSVDPDSALESLKQGIDLPVILTCRPERQGGHYPGDEAQRIEILSTAISSGVSWVDLEIDIHAEARDPLMEAASGNTKVVASLHSDEAPLSTSEIIQDVEDAADMGDMVKLCYKTSGRGDGLKLFEAAWDLRESDHDYTIMGSGWGGDWTRIHAPLLGQAMVYATMEKGFHLSRQGRINAADLQTAWKLLEYE